MNSKASCDFLAKIISAIKTGDVFYVNRLMSHSNPHVQTLAYFLALHYNKYELCTLLIKKGLRYANLPLENIRIDLDASTPLIDTLRMQYFDIAKEIFKKGYRINFLRDASDTVVYEMLLSCDEEWLEKITTHNYSYFELPMERLEKFLTYALWDDSILLFKKLITHPNLIHNKLDKWMLYQAIQQGASGIAEFIISHLHPLHFNKPQIHEIIHFLLTCKSYELPIRSKLFKRNSDPTLNESSHFTRYFNRTPYTLNERRGFILSRLLSFSHDINYQNQEGDSFLHLAIQTDNYECAKLLLAHNAAINLFNARRQTPIFYCKYSKSTELLLSHQARVNVKDSAGFSPLTYILHPSKQGKVSALIHLNVAIKIMQKEPVSSIAIFKEYFLYLVELIFDNKQISLLKKSLATICALGDWSDKLSEAIFMILDKKTPCYYGFDEKDFEINYQVLCLLCQYANDINYVNEKGENALHLATTKMLPAKFVELLVENGIAINQADYDGVTPLFYAYTTEIAHILVKAGANSETRDKLGRSPFIAVLLRMGFGAANVLYKNEKNHFLPQAFSAALFSASVDFCKENLNEEIYDFLVENGMELTGKTIDGMPYLHFAWQRSNWSFLKYYLNHQMDINLLDEQGNTLLFKAKSWFEEREAFLPLLIAAGLDINHKNGEGKTYLHALLSEKMDEYDESEYDSQREELDFSKFYSGMSLEGISLGPEDSTCYSRNQEEIVQHLMKAGANIHLLDKEGRNMLHYIAANKGLDPLCRHFATHFDITEFNRQDRCGKTPLHLLFEREKDDIKPRLLCDLLKNGANSTLADINGETPFHYLIRRKDKNVNALLRILQENKRHPIIILLEHPMRRKKRTEIHSWQPK